MKKYLLDTHVLLWFLEGNTKLSKKASEIIVEQPQSCLFSVASLWEITIKVSLEKLTMQYNLLELEELLYKNRIEILPIHFAHLRELIKLPFHHKDPFDRLLISQAKTEKLTIVSADTIFPDYQDIDILW